MAKKAGDEAAAVIELDSSDDEPEPATKKFKNHPKPNEMVSIPESMKHLVKKSIPQPASRHKVSVAPNPKHLIKNPLALKNLQIARNVINGSKLSIQPKNPQHLNTPQQIKMRPDPKVTFSNVQIKRGVPVGIKNNMPILPNKTSIVKVCPSDQVKNITPRPQYTEADLMTAKKIMQNVRVASYACKNLIGTSSSSSNLRRQIPVPSKTPTNQGIGLRPQFTTQAQKQKAISNLPPGITVKRVTKQKKPNMPFSPQVEAMRKRRKVSPTVTIEVPTVELDDDDEFPSQPSAASPQWYIHPSNMEKLENFEPDANMEVENNKEPEEGGREMIEITIDDSPIKPPNIPQTKMNSDLSIIIEDSPQKNKDDTIAESSTSGIKKNSEPKISEEYRSPQSKKKLNFPQGQSYIEVEVEFCGNLDYGTDKLGVISEESAKPIQEISNDSTVEDNGMNSGIFEEHTKQDTEGETEKDGAFSNSTAISEEKGTENECPVISSNVENNSDEVHNKISQDNILMKDDTEILTTVPNLNNDKQDSNKIIRLDKQTEEMKCVNSSPQAGSSLNKLQNSSSINTENGGASAIQSNFKCLDGLEEFNDTYKEFISLCFEMEDSEDMKKIVEKKVKEYYRQVDNSFTNSNPFKEFVATKIREIRLSPDNLYLYIKDVVDELKLKRKPKNKADVNKKNEEKPEEMEQSSNENRLVGDRRCRNIRKLEKTLRKLHRAVIKLEEQEVDFDDDADSVYLLTERYKERLVRVHAKLCQLTGTKMPSEPKITLDPRPGRPQGPTLKLERLINKKVPIGAPLPFPDFYDILQCVKEANKEDNIGWTDMEIEAEARDLFERCGRKLQKRRQKNEWRLVASRISDSKDPAEESSELKHRLHENSKIAHKKESDVINKYADRQNTLKLEPTEISENDIEESAPSSDDDVVAIEEDETTMSKIVLPLIEKIKIEKDDKNKNDFHLDEGNRNISKENAKSMELSNKYNTDGGEKQSEAESESALIRLVLSDDDANNASNNNETDNQSLLKERYKIEKLASSIESSDTDAPIAVSDSQESGDNKDLNPKSVEIVSIENSSVSESENDSSDYLSTEKNKEIHDSEEECNSVESVTETETGNDGMTLSCTTTTSSDEVKKDSTFSQTQIENTNKNEEIIDICSESTSSKFKSSSSSKLATKSDGEGSVKSLSDVPTLVSSDKCSDDQDSSSEYYCAGNTNQPQIRDDISVDTGKSTPGASSMLANENDSSSENQNSDTLIDIGPTIIQGVDIFNTEFDESLHSKPGSIEKPMRDNDSNGEVPEQSSVDHQAEEELNLALETDSINLVCSNPASTEASSEVNSSGSGDYMI